MKPYVLRREQFVPVELATVFPFFDRPENLGELTPPSLGFRILTPLPIRMAPGAVIDYVVRLGIFPVRWRTVITEYDPPHGFVDIQARGPYRLWEHRHTFLPAGDGIRSGTWIRDEVRYELPLGRLGRLVHAGFVRRMLERIFDFRAAVVAERFGAGSQPRTSAEKTAPARKAGAV